MFRSLARLALTTARVTQNVGIKAKPITPVMSVSAARTYTSMAVNTPLSLTPEEEDAAWIEIFSKQDMDTYEFIVAFMNLYKKDNVPEPKVVQSALYACRRIDNFPMAMRVLEMVKTKCYDRKDIYDYIMQELQPTFEDLGLTTVEEMKLHEVAD